MAWPGWPQPLFQRCREEHARLLPIPPHGPLRHPERRRHLLLRQPGEVPHLDYAHDSSIDCRELLERFVDSDDLVFSARDLIRHRGVEGEAAGPAAAPRCQASADEIDDHGAHRSTRIGEVAGPVLRTNAARAGEAQIGLIHQLGRLEDGVPPAAGKPTAGEQAQVRVQQCECALGRLAITLLGTTDE